MIKVLVIDDSPIDRKVLTHILDSADDIEVIGTAKNPYEAREKIADLKPDVLTLDILMPLMDGLTFLNKVMEHFPLPVVIVSSITTAESDLALTALRRGAVDVICKPDSRQTPVQMSRKLVASVRVAATANYRNVPDAAEFYYKNTGCRSEHQHFVDVENRLIAIGSSTGGTRALEKILTQLPDNLPAILVVQHMPEIFTHSFACRLNEKCGVRVREAKDDEKVNVGDVLIAPGNYHLTVEKKSDGYFTRVRSGKKVNYHRPSVDVLFHSVAEAAGVNATGVLLTGMGTDGAKGLLKMKTKGAHTVAQDEATSVVYGMPKEADKIGAALEVLPLQSIARSIINHMKVKAA